MKTLVPVSVVGMGQCVCRCHYGPILAPCKLLAEWEPSSSAVIQLAVNGIEPAPQGSKRHVGGGRMVEASKRVKPWRAAVAAEAMEVGQQISSACAVSIVFRFRRPKGHYKANGDLRDTAPRWCVVKRNDVDKCIRSTLDGLVQGELLVDDCLVVSINAQKRYCVGAEQPGAVINVMALG